MSINFKDIKQNFFINYSKYWITFFIILIIYILSNKGKYFFGTSKLNLGVENSIYITSGVAINNKHIIVNKDLIESACIGQLSGLQGNIYVIDKANVYRAIIDKTDKISNIALLRLKNYDDNLLNYSVIQIDQPIYDVNRRLIIPKTINKPAKFNFKEARVVDSKNNGFYLVLRNVYQTKSIVGMPVFNRNYVLQGIVKELNNDYENKTKQDSILNKSNIQKTYFVNNTNTIKQFLDKYDIEYSIVSGNVNLDNEKYGVKSSIVNVICIKTY